ncbi:MULTISPECIES: UPF0149 family protein [Thioalkalivibrio]|uniref:YecA family protein n=1 Tax=Thioalkalivibrio halophilus TaxID=252474 RepID=A0A1V3A192_9GAMM|nr:MULTISPECIES: YecA family protein [Thioalkalivibrio]OOC11104.1 hypothetical protein B1A74_02985 [Thioalkalivibrio halophilus]
MAQPWEERLAHGLRTMGFAQTPASAHGLITGCLVADPEAGNDLLIKSLGEALPLTENPAEAFDRLVDELRRHLLAQLYDIELGFAPLVPEDAEIETRAQALSEWADGFISGLGQTPRLGGLKPSAESAEILRDLAEIARMDPEPEDSEASEKDFEELSEYVRVGVLLIADELAPENPTRIPMQ